MIQITIAGRIGKDAVMRRAGEDDVCSFPVASSKKIKGEEQTIWIDCSLWGRRGETLCSYLQKGVAVTVAGELSTREHEGKTYLQCRVSDVALQSTREASARYGTTGAGASAKHGVESDDDAPF